MRKNIYQLIAEETCNPSEEIKRLKYLFEDERIWAAHSLKHYINKYTFRSLPIRGTSLNIDDLKSRLGVLGECDIDGLLSYCEFIYNIISQSANEIMRHDDSEIIKQARAITSNINWILERLNHETSEIGDKQVIIVEKNKATAQAASLIVDPAKALKIIEYNHIGLKGNLLAKQGILKQIGDIVEPILKSHSLKNGGYGDLESDAGFLLNNFQIRHENKYGTSKKDYIASVDDSTLEDWYDKAYNTMLMIIIANDQIEISRELKNLKGKYKW
jgi:hypothetical protein